MTNKRIWVTQSGMVHYRKPEEQEAKEYVEVTDQLPQVSASVALETESCVAVVPDSDIFPDEVWLAKGEHSQPLYQVKNTKFSKVKYVRADKALTAQKQEWMPIETAPKDGSRILLAAPWIPLDNARLQTCYGHWYKIGKRWEYDGYSFGNPTSQPVKWMPLPDANTPTPPQGD